MLPVGYAAFVGLGLAASILGVAWPFMRATFAVSLDAAGAILLPFTLGYLASSLACGPLLRRVELGIWLALGTGVLAAGLIASAAAPSWPLLIGISSLAGLGGGAIDAGLNVYGAARWSP